VIRKIGPHPHPRLHQEKFLKTQSIDRAVRLSLALSACAFAQTAAPCIRILLPERTRLREGQQVDLVPEVRNTKTVTNLTVMAGSTDLTSKFSVPNPATPDCNTAPAIVVRANLQSFPAGTISHTVSLTADGTAVQDYRSILVRPFQISRQRNLVLFIGDAMGTAYRDAARLVARSIVDDKGKNSFRDGFFDNLLEMDKMPVSGMVMTYGTDSVVPDSANTATAWATGNTSCLNALNVLSDGTDCAWRFTGLQNAATLPTMLDTPRVENLWQYMKRRFGYRTGIVTADVNMDVAYDKPGFQRPASEPLPNFGTYKDQPMLDQMTGKAIEVLSGYYSLFLTPAPFVLMVKGASIDKQSHPNQAAGQIWDTIEFDKAVGVGRAWAAKRPTLDTLVVVSADHDQSMSIIGVSNTPEAEYFDRTRTRKISITTPAGDQGITVYGDAYSNARAGLPFINANADASNNTGAGGTPGTFKPNSKASDPASGTYSTYYGSPAYTLDARSGYPVNSGAGTRRLAVGYRTGDHTGSSVPVTAEGPGALLFTGYMAQTGLFFKVATVLSTDTTDIDKLLDTLVNGGDRFPTSIGK
jgi:alkaline phosphatase